MEQRLSAIEQRLARIETKIDFLIEHRKDSTDALTKVNALNNRMIGGWVATTIIASASGFLAQLIFKIN